MKNFTMNKMIICTQYNKETKMKKKKTKKENISKHLKYRKEINKFNKIKTLKNRIEINHRIINKKIII